MNSRVGVPLVLGLGLLVGLVWLGSRDGSSSGSEPRPALTSGSTNDALLAFPELSRPAGTRAETELREQLSSEELRLEAAAAELVPEGEPPALIRGRVFDERWQPLDGARVTLCAIDAPWRADADLPSIEHEGEVRQGFRVRSDEFGIFEVRAPAPTALEIDLRIECGDERTISRRRYDEDFVFVAGENHLGEFVLQDAGRIRGRVRSPTGQPIAGAGIASLSWHGSPVPFSEADGSFHFPSMPVGLHRISVGAEGFEHALREVDVRARAEAEALAITLEPKEFAPDSSTRTRIAGIVVDASGRPLVGVRVHASEGNRGWARVSGADGSFAFEFVEPRNARIGFGREVAWRGDRDLPVAEPLVRLVVHAPHEVEFALPYELADLIVLDARSGLPVLSPAVELVSNPFLGRPRTVSLRSGGPRDAQTRAQDSEADWIRCSAPGQASCVARVESDVPGTTRMTLRLAGESRIRGRAVDAPYASVRLEAGTASLSLLTLIADAEGCFEFDGLTEGDYALQIWTADRESRRIEEIALAAEQLLDLGPIERESPEPAAQVERGWPRSGW